MAILDINHTKFSFNSYKIQIINFITHTFYAMML